MFQTAKTIVSLASNAESSTVYSSAPPMMAYVDHAEATTSAGVVYIKVKGRPLIEGKPYNMNSVDYLYYMGHNPIIMSASWHDEIPSQCEAYDAVARSVSNRK